MLLRFTLLLLLICSGCGVRPKTPEYCRQYAHLKNHKPNMIPNSSSEYYVLLLADARHLDYSDGKCLLRTLVKHPSDGSKNSDVGHAWILLHGVVDGKSVIVEGGHSGELGWCQPRYFDGIMNNIDYGYSNPTQKEKQCPRYEPNPIRYLWETQRDGFFQNEAGGHRPTYAIKINLTPKQFKSILLYINPMHYDYSNYAITGNQCSSFVANVAQIAGVNLCCKVTIPIPQRIRIGKEGYTLWEDPGYSQLTISTPDILEKSMMLAVEEGKVEYALPYYLKNRRKRRCPRCHWHTLCETLSDFPYRYKRARLFY